MRSKNFRVVENIVVESVPRSRAEGKPSKLWLIVFGILLAAGAWFAFARFYTDYL